MNRSDRGPGSGAPSSRPGREPATEASDADRLYAWLYDAGAVGWPGELELYRDIARAADWERLGVLDVGCGTGRIALALAADGFPVTGVDASPSMIEVARAKTQGANPTWAVGDMRQLGPGSMFGCIIVGGHAFQFMTTPDDAVAALSAMGGRLGAGGRIVLHLDNPDPAWLEALPEDPGAPQPAGEPRIHPLTGERWRMTSSWCLDRERRDAILSWAWQRLGPDDEVEAVVAQPAMRLHVFRPAEVDLAISAAGLATEILYGDFDRSPFTPGSPSMIWLIRRP